MAWKSVNVIPPATTRPSESTAQAVVALAPRTRLATDGLARICSLPSVLPTMPPIVTLLPSCTSKGIVMAERSTTSIPVPPLSVPEILPAPPNTN